MSSMSVTANGEREVDLLFQKFKTVNAYENVSVGVDLEEISVE